MTNAKKNSERAKQIMVPILGLVLLFVLMDSNEEVTATSVAPVEKSSTQNAIPKPKNVRQQAATPANWPRESLAAITAHNPFELHDPRALIDLAFAEAGLTGLPKMRPISAEEFFPKTNELSEIDDGDQHRPSANRTPQSTAMQKKLNNRRPTGTGPQRNDSDTSTRSEQIANRSEVATADHQRVIQLQERLMSLRSLPVRMFMKTQNGTSALLGSRKVTEGELFEDGIRIAAIDRAGITFEIVEPQSAKPKLLPDSQ